MALLVKHLGHNQRADPARKEKYEKSSQNADNKVISKTFVSAYNWIGLYAIKKGTYQVTFDVVDKEGALIKSKSLKVYANNEEAIKGIRLNGEKVNSSGLYIEKKDAVMKVEMAKGYKLTGIVLHETGTMSPEREIKNGKKFRLDKSDTEYGITVSYKDKYTGRADSLRFWIEHKEG